MSRGRRELAARPASPGSVGLSGQGAPRVGCRLSSPAAILTVVAAVFTLLLSLWALPVESIQDLARTVASSAPSELVIHQPTEEQQTQSGKATTGSSYRRDNQSRSEPEFELASADSEMSTSANMNETRQQAGPKIKLGTAELNPDASDTVPVYMQHMTIVLVTLHLSVFITGLVGNSLVCLSVYRNKSLQTITNYYIVNLAVADFLVILICLPPTVYWDLTLTWNFGLVLCKLVLYLQSISVSVSVLTLTCISIDRWYAICRPLKFSSTKSRAKRTIVLIWLASMLIASPDVIFLTTRSLYEEDDYVYMDCTYSWPENNTKMYQLCIVTLLFVLPFVLMIISYSQIVNVLWRNETMAESMQNSFQLEDEEKQLKLQRKNHESIISTTSQMYCNHQRAHHQERLGAAPAYKRQPLASVSTDNEDVPSPLGSPATSVQFQQVDLTTKRITACLGLQGLASRAKLSSATTSSTLMTSSSSFSAASGGSSTTSATRRAGDGHSSLSGGFSFAILKLCPGRKQSTPAGGRCDPRKRIVKVKSSRNSTGAGHRAASMKSHELDAGACDPSASSCSLPEQQDNKRTRAVSSLSPCEPNNMEIICGPDRGCRLSNTMEPAAPGDPPPMKTLQTKTKTKTKTTTTNDNDYNNDLLSEQPGQYSDDDERGRASAACFRRLLPCANYYRHDFGRSGAILGHQKSSTPAANKAPESNQQQQEQQQTESRPNVKINNNNNNENSNLNEVEYLAPAAAIEGGCFNEEPARSRTMSEAPVGSKANFVSPAGTTTRNNKANNNYDETKAPDTHNGCLSSAPSLWLTSANSPRGSSNVDSGPSTLPEERANGRSAESNEISGHAAAFKSRHEHERPVEGPQQPPPNSVDEDKAKGSGRRGGGQESSLKCTNKLPLDGDGYDDKLVDCEGRVSHGRREGQSGGVLMRAHLDVWEPQQHHRDGNSNNEPPMEKSKQRSMSDPRVSYITKAGHHRATKDHQQTRGFVVIDVSEVATRNDLECACWQARRRRNKLPHDDQNQEAEEARASSRELAGKGNHNHHHHYHRHHHKHRNHRQHQGRRRTSAAASLGGYNCNGSSAGRPLVRVREVADGEPVAAAEVSPATGKAPRARAPDCLTVAESGQRRRRRSEAQETPLDHSLAALRPKSASMTIFDSGIKLLAAGDYVGASALPSGHQVEPSNLSARGERAPIGRELQREQVQGLHRGGPDAARADNGLESLSPINGDEGDGDQKGASFHGRRASSVSWSPSGSRLVSVSCVCGGPSVTPPLTSHHCGLSQNGVDKTEIVRPDEEDELALEERWRNDDHDDHLDRHRCHGSSGHVVPTSTSQTDGHQACREISASEDGNATRNLLFIVDRDRGEGNICELANGSGSECKKASSASKSLFSREVEANSSTCISVSGQLTSSSCQPVAINQRGALGLDIECDVSPSQNPQESSSSGRASDLPLGSAQTNNADNQSADLPASRCCKLECFDWPTRRTGTMQTDPVLPSLRAKQSRDQLDSRVDKRVPPKSKQRHEQQIKTCQSNGHLSVCLLDESNCFRADSSPPLQAATSSGGSEFPASVSSQSAATSVPKPCTSWCKHHNNRQHQNQTPKSLARILRMKKFVRLFPLASAKSAAIKMSLSTASAAANYCLDNDNEQTSERTGCLASPNDRRVCFGGDQNQENFKVETARSGNVASAVTGAPADCTRETTPRTQTTTPPTSGSYHDVELLSRQHPGQWQITLRPTAGDGSGGRAGHERDSKSTSTALQVQQSEQQSTKSQLANSVNPQSHSHVQTSARLTVSKSNSNSAAVPVSSSTRYYKLIESRKKAAKMLIVIVIMFGLCYLPVHLINILRYTTGLPQNDITTIASLVSHWLCYFNSAVNPLIYNFMSGKFRHEFANLFFCRFLRRAAVAN